MFSLNDSQHMTDLRVCREKFLRTILGTSICMFRQCSLRVVFISRVRDEIGDSCDAELNSDHFQSKALPKWPRGLALIMQKQW